MTNTEIEFLRESNAIEGIDDDGSLKQAKEAWKFLKKQKNLTIGVILKTHKILMLNQNLQPDQKGYFRRCEVMIGGFYGVNWVKVPGEMAAWVKLAKSARTEDDTRFHHVEYERIHPFIDGNGRTGRMFMNWQRLKIGLRVLVIKADKRWEYYRWFHGGQKVENVV